MKIMFCGKLSTGCLLTHVHLFHSMMRDTHIQHSCLYQTGIKVWTGHWHEHFQTIMYYGTNCVHPLNRMSSYTGRSCLPSHISFPRSTKQEEKHLLELQTCSLRAYNYGKIPIKHWCHAPWVLTRKFLHKRVCHQDMG